MKKVGDLLKTTSINIRSHVEVEAPKISSFSWLPTNTHTHITWANKHLSQMSNHLTSLNMCWETVLSA